MILSVRVSVGGIFYYLLLNNSKTYFIISSFPIWKTLKSIQYKNISNVLIQTEIGFVEWRHQRYPFVGFVLSLESDFFYEYVTFARYVCTKLNVEQSFGTKIRFFPDWSINDDKIYEVVNCNYFFFRARATSKTNLFNWRHKTILQERTHARLSVDGLFKKINKSA